jgi:EamA-like transporter family protein
VVPPGLIVAPVCGLLATIFGAASLTRSDLEPRERERAMIGMALGVASTVTYLVPIFSTVLGVVVLGEGLSWNQPVGAAVVLLGEALTQGRLTPTPSPP